MKIFITGSAGFIGSALSLKLLEKGNTVVGIDNHNDYYDPELKKARVSRHINNRKYTHIEGNIEDRNLIRDIFRKYDFDAVVNLAAQAGVRYSIDNPYAYIDTNLVGFGNILEECRNNSISHFIYASSSSVYGLNSSQPFSTHDSVNHPISLYAATKKANELMAHTYSHLYDLPTTGLRFFTVYGPFDRPDMALQKFAKAMVSGDSIKVFNYGHHKRDFTFIDDIIEGIIRVINHIPTPNKSWKSESPDPSSSSAPYKIYNIGRNKPEELMKYIDSLEKNLGVKAKKDLLPMQPGDVPDTYADVEDLVSELDYKPKISLEEGIQKFVEWYKEYYKV